MTKLANCYSCVKYLVFAFNFLFWLLGCTVLAVGIWIKVDPNSIQQQYKNEAFQHFLSDSATFGYQSTGAYILIAVGTFIMFVGFLGCCGAIRESQCMLTMFFLALTLIFAVLMACGVYAILSRNDMESYIRLALVKAVNNYHNETNAAKLMDFVQSTFKCCGATESGGQDYGGLIPPSCGNNIRPCPAIIYHELTPNLVVIAGVTIGIAVVLMMGMLFSIMLCCAIRSTMT